MKYAILTFILSFASAAFSEVTVNAPTSYGPHGNNLYIENDWMEGSVTLGYDVMGVFFSFRRIIGCERLQILEQKILVCDGRVIGSLGDFETDGHSAPTARLKLNDGVDAHIWGTSNSKEFPLTFALTNIRSSDCGKDLAVSDVR